MAMAIIVGHRGVAGHAPENTLRAFQQALKLGLTHVEMDVRLTKDAVPVIMHDATVAKLTHGNEPISELSLQEVRALKVPSGREIPTLVQVLDLVDRKLALLIEIKVREAVGPVLDQVEARGLSNDVLLAAFDTEALIAAKRRAPHVKTCLLFRHPIGFLFRRREKELWAAVEDTRCDYIGPRYNVVSHQLVERAHALGRKVYAYHANTRRRGQRLLSLGVDAIGTDNPELFTASERVQ